jgi:excisionase family DNA binding protein
MEDDNKLPRRHSRGIAWPSGSLNRLLTIAEAAIVLGVKPQTLYLWVSLRRIPYRKIGRLVRFTESDLEEFISRQKQLPHEL